MTEASEVPSVTLQSQSQPQTNPASHEVRVDNFDDNDSSYGGDLDAASETTSLYSLITRHVYENGRRYHSYRAGTYWGPNDDTAQENLDLFHHIFNLSLDGNLFLAPIGPNPQRILDIGTGTGIWAIDVADQYPSASVVATDLSAIQPSDVPPNLEFQIDDFTLPWTFSKNTFDFVHARCIYGSVADYPALYSSVLDHLKPGGWFEQSEISVIPKSDDESINGTSLEQWGPLAWECGEKFGKSFKIAEESRDIMERAGFVNVQRKTVKWPIGPWAANRKMKEIGAYNRLGWDEGINGWAMFLLTKYLGWRSEEVEAMCAHIRRDLRNKHIHAYQDVNQKALLRGSSENYLAAPVVQVIPVIISPEERSSLTRCWSAISRRSSADDILAKGPPDFKATQNLQQQRPILTRDDKVKLNAATLELKSSEETRFLVASRELWLVDETQGTLDREDEAA
ncbi:related to TAM domain methyltransferase [Rhynchosporium agropyri]|uniref:Related to TAM domain methyltransferase n=1 Tax=Rhynchosporium agropyri TaxID=914238 RepID=A0A1E1KB37_9HELO|nr:related to TAM domain methyltransferase [Rhynchosporium agropyri]